MGTKPRLSLTLPPPQNAFIHLASQRTEEDALATANQIAARFGPLFDGESLEVQKADMGSRGMYYRVRVPAASHERAAEICGEIKAGGGDCEVM
jgi:hypothetical protein